MARARPPASPLGRLLELSSLALRVGVTSAASRIASFASPEAVKQARRTAELVKAAEQLVKTLGELKGAAMKVGQMLSLHDPLLPPEVAVVLRALQKQTPRVPFDVIEEQLTRELGDPGRLFLDFDEEAFAAASIGQVHRAVLRDGREVAVKVQYPRMDRIVEADLANLRRVLKRLVALVAKVDFEPIWRELRARLREELDYRIEAENVRRMTALHAGVDDLVIPRVVEEASTRRVLTMHHEGGLGPDEACAPDVPQALKDRWGTVLYEFLLRGLLGNRLLHADPNLANFAFRKDGRVVVYDFGCVKEVPPALASGYASLCRAVLEERSEEIPALLARMGVHRANGEPLADELIAPYLDLVLDLVQPGTPYRFGVDGTVHRRLFDAAWESVGEVSDMRFPADIVFVNRTVVGHLGNLTRLRAQGPWRESLARFSAEKAAETGR